MAELVIERKLASRGEKIPLVKEKTVLNLDEPLGQQMPVLDSVLAKATADVEPSHFGGAFYRFVGRLGVLGSILLLLTSVDAWKVIYFAGKEKRTDKAIQVIYDYRFRIERLFFAFGDWLWQGSKNTRSVRSRGKFVSLLFRIVDVSGRNIVSLGSGSARPLIDGLASNHFGRPAALCLVDTDQRSLDAGATRAHNDRINVIECNERADRYLMVAAEDSIDVFEVVGLLDYFRGPTFRSYARMIFSKLRDGGVFIGANISSKEEYEYAHSVARWPQMNYRPEAEIRIILEALGFHVWTGRCGLYTVWVAQKPHV